MKTAVAITCGLLIVGGCATSTPVSPEVKAEADRPLICEGQSQCTLYWQRALFYVNKNSRFKVQTVNDNLIQTYSPTGGDPSIAYNVSKEPLPNDSARLWVKVYCDNMFGCVPDSYSDMAAFKRYVRTGM